MTHCNSVHLTNARPDHADVRRWYISASGGKVLRLGTTEVPLERVENWYRLRGTRVRLPYVVLLGVLEYCLCSEYPGVLFLPAFLEVPCRIYGSCPSLLRL
jgi:hypothetical protein